MILVCSLGGEDQVKNAANEFKGQFEDEFGQWCPRIRLTISTSVGCRVILSDRKRAS